MKQIICFILSTALYGQTVTGQAVSAVAGSKSSHPAVSRALACPSFATLYIDSSVAASGDGSSWANAYKELREALAIALQCPNVAALYIAKGTYKPTDDGNRDSTFPVLRGGLKIYGGYAPGGAGRNISAYPTILSGDLGSQSSTMDNSFHVMVIAGLSSSADSVVVDGFTITAGNSNNSFTKVYNGYPAHNSYGGGMVLGNNSGAGGKIAVRNCIFSTHYAARSGGGIYSSGSSPTLTNCTFIANQAGALGGGGINGAFSSSIINCIFWANSIDGISGSSNTSYSIVQGTGVYPGTGNLNINPGFVNLSDPDGADNVFGTAEPRVTITMS